MANPSRHVVIMLACLIMAVSLWRCAQLNTAGQGEVLAKEHCSACHKFPEPDLLPKAIWMQQVLPLMALHIGIVSPPDTSESSLKRFLLLQSEGNYPAEASLSSADWDKIKAYYEKNSPVELQLENVSLSATYQFKIVHVDWPGSSAPSVTAVAIDVGNRLLYAAEESDRKIHQFQADGKFLRSLDSGSAISQIYPSRDRSLLITHIGFTIQPTESKAGYVERLLVDEEPEHDLLSRKTVLNGLPRPVTTIEADLDSDHVAELISCNFGNAAGSLVIWKRVGENWVKAFAYNSPGAIRSVVTDMNADGRPDIVALFAQGDERIVLLENNGQLAFSARTLLRFPPSYGSADLDVVDFNKDGLLDLIYTCGDNADYSITLKPYHGIYVYLNQGDTFVQKHFLPLHGAYRAVVRDFDSDGDLDIAAIAFFADYKNKPEAAFSYFENNMNKAFTSNFLPEITQRGRWIAMDSGDIDGDGDEDLVLGNYAVAQMFGAEDPTWKKSSGMTLLVNQGPRKNVIP